MKQAEVEAKIQDLRRKHGMSDATFYKWLAKYGSKDASLIAALPSTKNWTGKRDPDMSQSKKGNQSHFGIKAPIGMDAKSGLVHTVKTTTGKVHDAKLTDDLIRPDDKVTLAIRGM